MQLCISVSAPGSMKQLAKASGQWDLWDLTFFGDSWTKDVNGMAGLTEPSVTFDHSLELSTVAHR